MREKLTVIKVGGKIVEEDATLRQLLNDFAAIDGHKVLVHGGGRSATKIAAQLGIESKMVNGRRITDAETLKVVTMVYGGLVNKSIVAGLQARGVNALGLTGADMKSYSCPLLFLNYFFILVPPLSLIADAKVIITSDTPAFIASKEFSNFGIIPP